jgi:type IV secretory pathway VirB4 component
MRALRLPRHRSTTAHLASAYPFVADGRCGSAGVYLGRNVLTGGGAFAYDPFAAYRAGLVTNPNMLIAGEPGVGKSAAAKCFIYRSAGVFGRWVAVADPKGEYTDLAAALGLDVVRLHPGGHARINPLDQGEPTHTGREELVRRQAGAVSALLGCVLNRDLLPAEDAVLGWAIEHLADRRGEQTLADLARLMSEPTAEMISRARTTRDEFARTVDAVVYALGKLLERSLRGMFDGRSNVRLDWSGPGVVIDLSAVHHDPEALPLVMVAATSWLQSVLSRSDGPPRLQVLDEAWCLLAAERTTRYLQSWWKLGRSYGVANLAIIHRLSDLRAQADDGTATAKVSMGLLADTQTRVIFRQATDQIADARALLGLTATEADLVGRLCRARALWKIGSRTAVVQHVLAPSDRAFCDTDQKMDRG